jgi:hypothetical protein
VSGLDHARLAFVDGVAIDVGSNRLYLAAGFSGIDIEASRMLLLSGENRWLSHDVTSRMVSVHARRAPLEFWGLGRDGFVSIATESDVFEEEIEDAGTGKGKMGYVSQIRLIGDQFHVCGDLHQVYRRTNSEWVHMDEQILVRDVRAVGQGLNSIDGTAADDIYAVGDRGLILHYDGSHWTDTGSPTNCSLERVRSVSKDEVYVCGAKGTFLRGSRKGWELLGDIDRFEDDLWSLEWFQNKVYLATSTQLLVWDGKGIVSVDTGLDCPVNPHSLTSTETTLWSISVNDLFCFDGEHWSTVAYPDNQLKTRET